MPVSVPSRDLRIYSVLTISVAVASSLLGQFLFGAYDGSLLIDLGWRLQQHQLPYRDFPSTLPPTFIWSARLATTLFGNHWYAYTFVSSLLFVALAGAGWLMTRHAEPPDGPYKLRLLYLASISIPQLATSHMWHATFAAQCAVMLCLNLYLVFADSALRNRKALSLSATLVAASLFLSKPNIAIAAILASIAFPLCASHKAKALLRWIAFNLAAAGIATIGLLLTNISPRSLIASYAHVTGRPDPIELMSGFLFPHADWTIRLEAPLTYAVIVLLITACTIHRRTQTIAPAIYGVAVTLTGLSTNWELRLNDVAPALFGMSLPLLATTSRPARRLHKAALALALLTLAIVAATRTRMRGVGPWARPTYGKLVYRHDDFFGPFVSRNSMWRIHDEITSLVRRAPHASVFFGPRLEFEYAAQRLASPRGMPIWWHPGSSYTPQDEPSLRAAWSTHAFPILILLPFAQDGTVRLPAWLLSDVQTHYICRTSASGLLLVCQRHPS